MALLAFTACATLTAGATFTQTFPIPGTPLRIAVPFPPSGAADIQASPRSQHPCGFAPYFQFHRLQMLARAFARKQAWSTVNHRTCI